MQNTAVMYLEHTAVDFPEKIAVKDAKRTYKFSELRDKARALAAAIEKKLHGRRNVPIAVYLPKSADCLMAFMAVLYSGCCYVPLDTKMPEARLNRILTEAMPPVVVTYSTLADKVSKIIDDTVILSMDEADSFLDEQPEGYLETIDTDPAYIIYTSGSTGQPKGVTIAHRGIIDYIDWAGDTLGITAEDKLGSQSPFYFDNSTLDIYSCLSKGAELDIIPEMLFSFPVKLVDYLKENKITSIFWVPSVMINIANTDSLSDTKGLTLKHVMFAGEVMPNRQLNYWRRKLPEAQYVNLYGPTEITVDCTYYVVDSEYRDDEPLPIGEPCHNSDVFLLDENDKLVTKDGEQGELCVRGSSLALGYWNNAEKTAAAFTQNPLRPNYPERIYRTGDLATWTERASKRVLLYAGRKDSQIKHMGYRIELGEIETAAASLSRLDKVCALYDGSQIVLYYEAHEEIETKDIRIELSKLLPKYMIPTAYVWQQKLPLNPNGKIDRNRLKEMLVG